MLPSKPLIGLLALFLALPALAARPALSAHDYAWLKVASQARDPAFAQKLARGLSPSAAHEQASDVVFEKSRLEFADSYVKSKGARTASQPAALASPAASPKPEAAAPLAGCSASGATESVGGGLLLLAWLATERRRVFARARRPSQR